VFTNKKIQNIFISLFASITLFCSFLLPVNAKTIPTLAQAEKNSEVVHVVTDLKNTLAFDLELDDEIVNIPFFSSKILSVKGVLLLLAKLHDHKKFRVVFDHRFTNVKELAEVIEQIVNDPETYKEETHEK